MINIVIKEVKIFNCITIHNYFLNRLKRAVILMVMSNNKKGT